MRMKYYKTSKLLNNSTVPKLWQKNGLKQMICHKTSILRSYLCDHNDTYIVVKGTRDL